MDARIANQLRHRKRTLFIDSKDCFCTAGICEGVKYSWHDIKNNVEVDIFPHMGIIRRKEDEVTRIDGNVIAWYDKGPDCGSSGDIIAVLPGEKTYRFDIAAGTVTEKMIPPEYKMFNWLPIEYEPLRSIDPGTGKVMNENVADIGESVFKEARKRRIVARKDTGEILYNPDRPETWGNKLYQEGKAEYEERRRMKKRHLARIQKRWIGAIDCDMYERVLLAIDKASKGRVLTAHVFQK